MFNLFIFIDIFLFSIPSSCPNLMDKLKKRKFNNYSLHKWIKPFWKPILVVWHFENLLSFFDTFKTQWSAMISAFFVLTARILHPHLYHILIGNNQVCCQSWQHISALFVDQKELTFYLRLNTNWFTNIFKLCLHFWTRYLFSQFGNNFNCGTNHRM